MLSRTDRPARVVWVAGRAVNGALPKRLWMDPQAAGPHQGNMQDMKSVARSMSLPVSPHSRRGLAATGADRVPTKAADLGDRKTTRAASRDSDDSTDYTCDITHSSDPSSSGVSSSSDTNLNAPSSITISTCNFPP